MSDNPLGQVTEYPQRYAPGVLHSLPRARARERSGIDTHSLPFGGFDLWRAYELSWLNSDGKPRVAIAELRFPCDSPWLIESKSLKLYCFSLNRERFANAETVRQRMQNDLGAAAGAEVDVQLFDLGAGRAQTALFTNEGATSLDDLPVTIDTWQPDASLLQSDSGRFVEEALCSDLFRSLCPVTGQPDWGSVLVRYRGPAIDHASLLRYLVSYREHAGFHEDCVEAFFNDLHHRCRPESLLVAIHFLRRGGLEINPYRMTGIEAGPIGRGERQ